jgi:carbonic anhydrase
MEGNRRYAACKPMSRDLRALRRQLLKEQHPRSVVLSCADSRVPPEVIFDQTLGDLFVIRSAGAITDSVGIGSIEYAVARLGCKVLLVLGHTQCGAINAACSNIKMPTTHLRELVSEIRRSVAQLGEPLRGEDLITAAIRANIHQSAKNLVERSSLLRRFVATGELFVIEAEYILETGNVIRL